MIGSLNDGEDDAENRGGSERVEVNGDGVVEGKEPKIKDGVLLDRKAEPDPGSELPKLKPVPGLPK